MNDSVIQRAIELRDPKLAREALREIDLLLASTSDPDERVYLLFSKSSCYGILGNFEEARKQLSSALEQEPEGPNTRLAFDLSGGLLCQQEGNYREAHERFSAALSKHTQRLNRPELRFMYEDIQTRRAFLSVTLCQFPDAIPLLREILSFDLKKEIRSDALASLGRCYLELRDWESAKEYFLQASAIGVTSAKRHFIFVLESHTSTRRLLLKRNGSSTSARHVQASINCRP